MPRRKPPGDKKLLCWCGFKETLNLNLSWVSDIWIGEGLIRWGIEGGEVKFVTGRCEGKRCIRRGGRTFIIELKVTAKMFGDASEMLLVSKLLTGWAIVRVWLTAEPAGECTDNANELVQMKSPVYSNWSACWVARTASEISSPHTSLIPGCYWNRQTPTWLNDWSGGTNIRRVLSPFLSFHSLHNHFCHCSCAQHAFEDWWLCSFLPVFEPPLSLTAIFSFFVWVFRATTKTSAFRCAWTICHTSLFLFFFYCHTPAFSVACLQVFCKKC